MSESKDDVASPIRTEGAYEVGFRKPPEQHRFKPGNSGNPRGRKKLSGNVFHAFRGTLDEQIRITDGKKSKKVSKAEAYVRLQVNRAIQGNYSAFMWVIKQADKVTKIRPLTEAQERSGVLVMPFEFFSKSRAEQSVDIEKEAARRNDLLARGLRYE